VLTLVASICNTIAFSSTNGRSAFVQGHPTVTAGAPPLPQSNIFPPPHFSTSLSQSSGSSTETPDADAQPTMMNSAIAKIGKTTSAVVALTFFVFLSYYRDSLMLSFWIGAISNGILSKVLKKIINQSRPTTTADNASKIQPSDGGMPSSHGMSLGFICTFTALTVTWTQLPLFIYSMISLVYRVQSKLHTWQQVAVGGTVGSFNGYLWHALCFDHNVIEWVSSNILNGADAMPVYYLAVPAFVGLAVVGSFERRLSNFFKQRKQQ